MIQYQLAQTKDFPAIAALHADSWRRHYQGVMQDAYLQNEIEAERLKDWEERFASPNTNQHTLVAKSEDLLCGFVCTYFDSYENYTGSLLENIHVKHGFEGKGIGKYLFSQAAQWVYQQSQHKSMYLWVLAHNQGAIGFYDKLGGIAKEIEDWEMPGGGTTKIIRYVWEDLRPFI